MKFATPELQKKITNISLLHTKYLRQTLQEKSLLLEAETRKAQNLSQKLSCKYLPAERVYVMQNTVYDLNNMFKIGRTKDLSKRLSTYNTSNPGGVLIMYERCCRDSKLVETMVHHILSDKRCERNREYFECPLEWIKKTIDHCVESCDKFRSTLCERDEVESAVSGHFDVEQERELFVQSTPKISPYFEKYRYRGETQGSGLHPPLSAAFRTARSLI